MAESVVIVCDVCGRTPAEQVTIKDRASSRAWTRYSVRILRPKKLRARHKEMAETVRLQLAVPRRPEPGRLFVGLPLDEECTLPYSASGPFEPNVDRTHLRDNNKLNVSDVGITRSEPNHFVVRPLTRKCLSEQAGGAKNENVHSVIFQPLVEGFSIAESGPSLILLGDNRLLFQSPINLQVRIVPGQRPLMLWCVKIGRFV